MLKSLGLDREKKMYPVRTHLEMKLVFEAHVKSVRARQPHYSQKEAHAVGSSAVCLENMGQEVAASSLLPKRH
jgi:hypothetical protein